MACSRCGRQCAGRRCAHCLREKNQQETRESGAYDTTSFTCPECGGETSGRGVTCYHCRGGED